MDNGKEFKGAVLMLLKGVGIRVIHGRLRRPQPQGLVEQGNGLAKSKLSIHLKEIGTQRWAAGLPGVAMQMNDQPHDSLPNSMTSFEEMMSRRIHRAVRIPHRDRAELCKVSDEDIDRYCAADTSKGKAKATKVDEGIDRFIDQLPQEVVIPSEDEDGDDDEDDDADADADADDDEDDESEIDEAAIRRQVAELGLGPTTPSHINPDRLFPEKVIDLPAPVLPLLLHIPSRPPPSDDPFLSNAAPPQDTTLPENILEDSTSSSVSTAISSEDEPVTRQEPLTDIGRQIERETQEHQAGQRAAMKKKHDGKRNVVIFKKGDFASLAIFKGDRIVEWM